VLQQNGEKKKKNSTSKFLFQFSQLEKKNGVPNKHLNRLNYPCVSANDLSIPCIRGGGGVQPIIIIIIIIIKKSKKVTKNISRNIIFKFVTEQKNVEKSKRHHRPTKATEDG